MTPERFAALADAYGGEIARWPAEERGTARAHLAENPAAQQALALQAGLDGALAGWTMEGPGAALAGRIAAAATRQRSYARRVRLWLSGLGAATALSGGIAAGAGMALLASPPSDLAAAQAYESSAPVDFGADEF